MLLAYPGYVAEAGSSYTLDALAALPEPVRKQVFGDFVFAQIEVGVTTHTHTHTH